MSAGELLRPALDAVAPPEEAAALRRVRLAAAWLAISAWLLPPLGSLGTDTIERRAVICAGFLVAAIAAHVGRHHAWGWKAALAASALAGAAVGWAGRGAMWGFGFAAFAGVVVGLTELRVRIGRPAPLHVEYDPLPPQRRLGPRVLAWLGWLGISLMTLRAFTGQAMVVPTASMYPTILGASMTPPRMGDHLFVENFTYLFRDPTRWEIVVFQWPLDSDRFFVKRVVGLPGEHIELKDGDLWVNGTIAKKPRVVQQTMWQDLYPRAGHLGSVKQVQDAWQPSVMDESDRWKKEGPQALRGTPRGGEPTFIGLSTNSRAPAPPDLRVAFTAVPEERAQVLARITSRGVLVTLSVPQAAAAGRASLDVGGKRTEFDAAISGATRLELCVADGEAWALVDGRELVRADVPAGGRGKNRIEMGAAVAAVSFSDPVAGGDIQYKPSTRGTAAWDVPGDGFFFIGDNQLEQSDDSREWKVKVFHPPGGAAPLRAANELIIERDDGQIDRVINVKGDATNWRFKDVDAVPREIPKAGTTIEDNVPMPFARRDHLVGRAIMVFFPFPPFSSEWRPRLLP